MSPRWNSTVEERFWRKVDKQHPSGCWVWRGATLKGYGVVYLGGVGRDRKQMLAHRYAYETLAGPIPERLVIDHLCRNPACVNPAHMEPVPIAENTRRGALSQSHCHRGHPRPVERRAAYKHCLECKRQRSKVPAICIHCGWARGRSNMRRTYEGWICGPNLVCYRQRYGEEAS